ncbi:ribosome small subunit-dependent GTPase A [Streptomyces sp. TR06-5]|uniref:ribosome small subunit-dependent GTPase A n=1 Tax=unclassified Streptomyces TaxID=2593676 RepID=UPI0039A2B153
MNESFAHHPHPLARYGWDEQVAAAFAPYAAQGLLPARVVRVHRAGCDILTADGTCRAGTGPVATRDPVNSLTTGDWAAVGDGDDGRPEVKAVLPRRTAFLRSTSSKRSEGQVLAANIDHAVIAVPLAADPDLGRLERFVSLAWASGAAPFVALTKADLVPEAATLSHLAEDCRGVAPGVPVLTVSSRTGEGIDGLRAAVAGSGTTVLLGVSGAGKSTLANALLGEDTQTVYAVRDRDGKGRHTTTTRDLLPLPGGGVLIDTPGLRGVGLWDAEHGLDHAFSEIEELARTCRFQDCAHRSEPGCAVTAAAEDGSLPERRLDSYRKLLRENAYLAARTDVRLRNEQKQQAKQRRAHGRRAAEHKRRGHRP